MIERRGHMKALVAEAILAPVAAGAAVTVGLTYVFAAVVDLNLLRLAAAALLGAGATTLVLRARAKTIERLRDEAGISEDDDFPTGAVSPTS